MNITKLFRNKTEANGEQYEKVQKTKPLKKSAQKAAKAKKADSAKKTSKKSDETRINWWQRLRQYVREVAYELRKVIWPSRKETIGTTSVVLVIVILAGIFLGFVDLILSRLVRLLIG